jgi:hypothetical protein
MEIANLIVNIFVALGTISAVIVALYLNYANGKPKLKILKVHTEDEKELYFSFQIFNNGSFEPIVKQLGFSNKKEMHWQKLGDMKRQYKKEFLDETMLDKISYYHYPVKIKSGEMLGIMLKREEVQNLKDNIKYNKVKLKLIFIDESRITIKLTKKEINDYLEQSYMFNDKNK